MTMLTLGVNRPLMKQKPKWFLSDISQKLLWSFSILASVLNIYFSAICKSDIICQLQRNLSP